jgi:hypothetical protein
MTDAQTTMTDVEAVTRGADILAIAYALVEIAEQLRAMAGDEVIGDAKRQPADRPHAAGRCRARVRHSAINVASPVS